MVALERACWQEQHFVAQVPPRPAVVGARNAFPLFRNSSDRQIPQIYHSSYDCTLRVTNFETGMSEEVIDGDRWSDEALLHSFDFDPTGNELWGALCPLFPGSLAC
jgi:hypothetical protein